MGYMQGITKRGIDFVSRITGLLNQLTEEDFDDVHVWLRVSLIDESSKEEIGFWSNEYGFGDWAYFDGPRRDLLKPYREVADGDTLEQIEKDIKHAMNDFRRIFPEPEKLPPNLHLAVRALALLQAERET